ncbi:MAG: LptF/LptG family permease [Candidatus Aminicenantes bacterium]|nr:LptF/LptG family permease [Candidatus Aminicenantes bacterium]
MFRTFDRYIVREVTPPFFLGLLLFSFVLLMNQILILTEQIVTRGVSVLATVELLMFLMPAILAFSVPMAVLMGILAGLSRLSSDYEVTAFRTLGIGRSRLLRPLFFFAVGGWLLTSFFTLYLAPRSNALYVRTYVSRVLHRVHFRVTPRVFNETLPDTVIYVQDAEGRDERWENILLSLKTDPNEPRLILARRGRLDASPDLKRLILSLSEGIDHSYPLDAPEKYRITFFQSLREDMPVESLLASFHHAPTVREKDIFELWKGEASVKSAIRDLERRRDGPGLDAGGRLDLDRRNREHRSHWIEIHKRFALPFACLVFVFLGLPLGVSTRKGGRTSGFTISIAIILAYYILITAGEQLARDGKITPFAGMWGPNVLFLLFSLALYLRVGRERRISVRAPRLFSRPARAMGTAAGRPRIRQARQWPGFPRILDRYIIRKYALFFGLVFTGLLALTVVVTFFERINTVYDHKKPISLLLRFLWHSLPDYANYILPVAALTAMLLSLGILTKFNEVTAMKAAGISLYRLIVPVVILAVAVSLASFYLQERVLPVSNTKANRVWDAINDLPARSYNPLERTWMVNRAKNRFFHYSYFDPRRSAFRQLTILDVDGREWALTRRLFAEHAVLDEGTLTLTDGWQRRFAKDSPVPFERFDRLEMPLEETRNFFLKEWKEPSQMTLGELRAYIREVRDLGFDTGRLQVDWQTKLALPLVAVIMTLIGIPFAFAMGRRGTLVGIAVGVVIAMVYWGALGLFRGLGYAGTLSPFLAAWGPNLLFGAGGIFALLNLRT